MTGLIESRRDFVRAALAAGVLLPAGLSGAIAQALAQGNAKQGMNRLRGDVRVNGQAAQKGSRVQPGDTISTGAGSFATFVVGDDAFLVRGNSQVELGGAQAFVNVLRVLTGKVLSVYSKGTPRKIQGVTATIGIRGTGAYIETAADKTYFCLCYGEAEIVPVAAPERKETVRTTHHESPRYIYAGAGDRVMEKARVINHSDAELVLLESLVGRVPPFVDMDEYKSGVRY
jgi:hypothetical protein